MRDQTMGKKTRIGVLAVLIILAVLAVVFFFGKENTVSDMFTVTYYADDGSILKIDTVANHGVSVPPVEPLMTYGKIFKSWDTDFSDVTENLEVHPICEEISGKTNAFAMPGVYGKTGDTVVVPILLCGNVCTAGFDITVTYDAEALELTSIEEDGAVVYNAETPGKIRINYVSIENTESDVDVMQIGFLVKADSGNHAVDMAVNEIYACHDGLETNDDSLYVPESYVTAGTVCVIP